MVEMHTVEVGKSFPVDLRGKRGTLLEITDDFKVTFYILISKITAYEQKEIYKQSQFGIYIQEDILFFLAKFGDMNWMDAPFHAGLYNKMPSKMPSMPSNITPETRIGLVTYVIDTFDNICHKINFCSLSPEVSQIIYNKVSEQILAGMPQDYDAKLSKIWSKLSTDKMVAKALATCKGGD